MNVHIYVFVYMWKKHRTVKGGYNERSLSGQKYKHGNRRVLSKDNKDGI